jgi:DNA-binding transcriptional LysR family regulator
MSGILARLRAQLGDELLVRVGRDMQLTPHAVEIKEEVRQILLRVENLKIANSEPQIAGLSRHFNIMMSEFGLTCIFPMVFNQILKAGSGVSITSIPIHTPAAGVYNGIADICITGEPIGEITGEMASQLKSQTLMQERMVGLVDQNHPLDGAITAVDLASFPNIATQFPGSRWTVGDIAMDDYSGTVHPRLLVGGFMTIGTLVSGNEAVGIVPERIADIVSRGTRLKTLQLPSSFKPIDMRMIWHARYNRDPGHRWLRELINEASNSLRSHAIKTVPLPSKALEMEITTAPVGPVVHGNGEAGS